MSKPSQEHIAEASAYMFGVTTLALSAMFGFDVARDVLRNWGAVAQCDETWDETVKAVEEARKRGDDRRKTEMVNKG